MLSKALCLLVLTAAAAITANPDAGRTPRNTPVTTRVLANDTSSGTPLNPGSVTIVTPSANGTATVNADGTVTFRPSAGFSGTTTYRYRVCDTSKPESVCATAVVTITVTAPVAGAAPGTGTVLPPPSGGIRISIKNEYVAKLNFGPLGKGSRDGTDTAEGVLTRQGDKYVGIVDAAVDSNQTLSGLAGRCGPARYQGSQKLKVIGHPTDSFNQHSQSVDAATMTGQASNEYLALEFAPETMTSAQTSPRLPQQMLPDLVVSCHTLIDTLSGIAFLPLNDSRWTMEGGGYIIRLPSSGTIRYTDRTVPAAGGLQIGPFDASKSVWTIVVERLP